MYRGSAVEALCVRGDVDSRVGDCDKGNTLKMEADGGHLMERTESTVVQVAPQQENEMIQEMELFGWNLQGRQEIQESGQAYGRPSYLSELTDTYVVKITVTSYVKLHFVRSLKMPNLDRLKEIQEEYFSLPFPKAPSLLLPKAVIAFFSFGILVVVPSFMLNDELGGVGFGIFALLVYGVFVLLGVRWLKKRQLQQAHAYEMVKASRKRMEELRMTAKSLLME